LSRSAKTQWFLRLPMCVHYAFVPNAREWDKVVKELDDSPDPYPTHDGLTRFYERCPTTKSRPYRFVILVTINPRVDTHKNKVEVAGLIAHEATHVWQYMREAVNEKEKPSSELDALYIEMITRDLLSAYCKTRKNIFR
jgi:hypothetical protein